MLSDFLVILTKRLFSSPHTAKVDTNNWFPLQHVVTVEEAAGDVGFSATYNSSNLCSSNNSKVTKENVIVPETSATRWAQKCMT